jgi:hypothetical protein
VSTHRFAPVFRAPHPDTPEEEITRAYQRGHDDAHGEIYDANALSWCDQFGRKHLYHVRCGRKLGAALFCFRRADHPDNCDVRWEYP